MTERMILADCLLAMPEMEPESIASVCTDPPYGLKFMGKLWDHGVPGEPYWREVLRVLKPGGYLVAFGGTRTHHRLMVAIEDAGFEIRDCLIWLYGSGFPKGKGCLKPGWEPIVLARKPAPAPWLNVDGCRLGALTSEEIARSGKSTNGVVYGKLDSVDWKRLVQEHSGRWPANVVLSHEDGCREVGTKRVKGARGEADYTVTGMQRSVPVIRNVKTGRHHADVDGLETVSVWECMPECAVRLLDEQSGVSRSSGLYNAQDHGPNGNHRSTDFGGRGTPATMYADHGGPSRFFYCSKASRKERGAYNDHPTVKPLALMQWLVRLVTPPGGVVLDPFCGSGSTLLAARDEGFDVIGIDNDPHAFDITRKRLGCEEAPVLIVDDRVRILAVRRQPREAVRE